MTIQLNNINKSFKGNGVETQVLKGINLTLKRYEFTVIVGSSGSGKSTLLSLIGALDNPTSGQITIGDIDVSKLKGNKLADFRFDKIGLVFQHFHLLPTLTAIENVMAPFFGRRTDIPYNKKAKELLIKLGLEDKAHLLPSQLSGGEQQRIAIARALVNEPDWLLADEPTGNLDSHNSEIFYEMLHQLKLNLGCGIIVVTHDLKLAEEGDRIIEIKDGKIVEETNEIVGNIQC